MILSPNPLGAVPLDDQRTTFCVWAPRADRLWLRLLPGACEWEMTRDREGYFTIQAVAPAGTEYLFRFADGRCRPDPASRAQPHGVHGPSRVVAPHFAWSDHCWRNPPLSRHIFYELHVGTFTPAGTFDAVIERIDDLRALGVTAIELMPIAQFPGQRNWGYDGVLPYAAQWSYGGIDGLRRLVDAAHARGLAVLLDVVYNHLGPEGNYLAEFGPYFTDTYRTPWGQAMNFDGPDSDQVREFFIQNALYWVLEAHLDGLRLDAVHAIVDHTARTFIEDLAARVHAAADATGRRILVIAESADNDPRLVRAPEIGGAGLDGCWNDDYHHAIRTAITGQRQGYYVPFGRASHVARAIRDRYVLAGGYCIGRRRRHGAPAHDVPHHRLLVFTQNHDQVGNRPLGDRLDRSAGLDGARVAAGLVLLSPFTPLLFMGEEYAEPAPFQYFVSHTDPVLAEAVRKGRREEFPEMHGDIQVPDPQDAATFARSKLDWSSRTRWPHAQMLAYYRRLIEFRRSLLDAPAEVHPLAWDEPGVVALVYGEAPRLAVVGNLSATAADVALPNLLGPWRVVLDSNDPAFGGGGCSPAPQPGTGTLWVSLKPRTLLVLRKEQ